MASPATERVTTRQLLVQLPRAWRLVWTADRPGAIALIVVMALQSVLPAAMAWIGKLIIDAVVRSSQHPDASTRNDVLRYVTWELALAASGLAISRLNLYIKELLRVNLGNQINERILEKAIALNLQHFEDSKTYDLMQNARREASTRPLSLAMSALGVVRSLLTLATFIPLLWAISWWSVFVLVLAAIPSFVAETRLSKDAFRLYSWRAPEGRKLGYLEWILTRDSHVKEVKLFGLGQPILNRYRSLFQKFLAEDRRLAVKRLVWGVVLSVISLAAFYACYVLVAARAADGLMTVGDLTLYLTVFRSGQSAFESALTSIAGMYEDALFLSNLYRFLELPTGRGEASTSAAPILVRGPHSLELRGVSFRYPGREDWALKGINLILSPGEKLALVGENGAGKSTLIKLLLRFYDPTEGSIFYGGVDLRNFDQNELRSRFGAVFQDFVRYQFTASENIGLGHPEKLNDRPAIEIAAAAGGAADIVEALPQSYDTMLGGWFEKGVDLSAGQWQKLAIARAFMRDAEILILDEPTAAIDAEAEVALFERFQTLSKDRTAIIISHRFSTVRMADRIAVLDAGRIVESGSHGDLIALGGRYARLFSLQAQGYR